MPISRPAYAIDQSPFYRLGTKRRLAALLDVTEPELRRLTQGSNLYREWDMITPKGKVRHIENPMPSLKRLQGRVASLLTRIAPPNYLFCPVKRRSYITNAAQHIGCAVIRTLDIKDYFASTPSRRVFWFFQKILECASDVAAILAKVATINGHLATGSPLSPILSFFAHLNMWEEIDQIAREAGCTVTVYMDDVTVSGPQVSDRVMWQIKQCVHRCGLVYHKKKHFKDKPAEVTGVIVGQATLSLPNRKIKALYEGRLALRLIACSDQGLPRTRGKRPGSQAGAEPSLTRSGR